MDKAIICYRGSENKNGANPSCISKSTISSHQSKDGDATSEQRKGLFKNSGEKPVICFHRRGDTSKSASIITSHMIRDAAAAALMEVGVTGRKRKRMSVVLPLPDDIFDSEILTRLPAKYIMRSRLVCKSWNSLLFNSEFVKSHLARMHSYPYKDDDEDLIIAKSVPFSDGIHILSRTKEIQHPKDCKHLLGGFSWDHMQNDYKVVLVCHDPLTFSPKQLIIYSSNSATWTQILMPHIVLPNGHAYGNWYPIVQHPTTFVKGIPYWKYSHSMLLPGKKRRRKFTSVFKFMPETNEFRLLPDLDLLKLRGKKFSIAEVENGLVGMAYKRRCADSLVDIYSLDTETHSGVWSKMYTVGPINLSGRGWKLSQCFKNGGEIFIDRCSCPPSFYDPKTKTSKILESDDLNRKFKQCFSYTPSLVCVQGMVSIQQFLKNRDNEMSHDDLKAFSCI